MDDVIAKITKRARDLMRRTEGRGFSEHEAAAAAEKLQEILQKYNLSMAQVALEEDGPRGPSSSDIDRAKVETEVPAIHQYQRDLMGAVASTNFCLHRVMSYVAGDRHCLVGRKVNVDLTIMSYGYLHETIVRLAREGGFTACRDREFFLEGAVNRISSRLYAKRREAERASEEAQTTGGGTALVRLEDVYGSESDRNNDVLNGYPIGTTAQRRREEQVRQEKRAAQRARFEAAGLSPDVAMYLSSGYSPEEAVRYAAEAAKAPRGRYRSGRAAFSREDRRYTAKVNSAAYRAGVAAGAEVGLDPQVAQSRRKRIA